MSRTGAIVAPVREGLAAAPKTLADFDIAPYVRVRMGDDVAVCRDVGSLLLAGATKESARVVAEAVL
jgi:hypothetical protein